MNESKTYNLTPDFLKICRTVCLVMLSMAILCLILDAVFLSKSRFWLLILIDSVGILSSIAFLFIFVKTMQHKQIIETKDVINKLSIIAFGLLLIAISPLLIYLLLGEQWVLVNEYGFTGFVVKSIDIYYRAAIYTGLLVVITYWTMVIFTIRESSLYKQLNKKKNEVYEKN